MASSSKNDDTNQDGTSNFSAESMFKFTRREDPESDFQGETRSWESDITKKKDEIDDPLYDQARELLLENAKQPRSISEQVSLHLRIKNCIEMVNLGRFRQEVLFNNSNVTDLRNLKEGDHIYFKGISPVFVKYHHHHMIVSKVDVSSRVFEVIELTVKKTLMTITKPIVPSIKEATTLLFVNGFKSGKCQEALQFFGDSAYENDKEGVQGIIRKKTFIMSDDYRSFKKSGSQKEKWRNDLIVREYSDVFNKFVIWFYQVAFGYKVTIDIAPAARVARATKLIGDHEYHLFRCNCEQFATWCCTGLFYSEQIHDHDRTTVKPA